MIQEAIGAVLTVTVAVDGALMKGSGSVDPGAQTEDGLILTMGGVGFEGELLSRLTTDFTTSVIILIISLVKGAVVATDADADADEEAEAGSLTPLLMGGTTGF